ncbi:hypothetical protein JKP88DRAFT_322597 [Tribonema minus]|uniref:Uncharacterized protein n=1 Tax=Tribonema minus TaxID=303371 RepID=A0A836CCS4_9STRA|nr:hypothetical protein JKP88DRAFT_322597 [Tribonema minus]
MGTCKPLLPASAVLLSLLPTLDAFAPVLTVRTRSRFRQCSQAPRIRPASVVTGLCMVASDTGGTAGAGGAAAATAADAVEGIMTMPTIDIKLELQMRGIDHRDALEKQELARRLAQARASQAQPVSVATDPSIERAAAKAMEMGEGGLRRALRDMGIPFSQLADAPELARLYAAAVAERKAARAEREPFISYYPYERVPGDAAERRRPPTTTRSRGERDDRGTPRDASRRGDRSKRPLAYAARSDGGRMREPPLPPPTTYAAAAAASEAVFAQEARELSTRELMAELDRVGAPYDVLAARGALEEAYVRHCLAAGASPTSTGPTSNPSGGGGGGVLRAKPRRSGGGGGSGSGGGGGGDTASYDSALHWASRLTYEDIIEELRARDISVGGGSGGGGGGADFGALARRLARAVAAEERALMLSADEQQQQRSSSSASSRAGWRNGAGADDASYDMYGSGGGDDDDGESGYYSPARIALDAVGALFSLTERIITGGHDPSDDEEDEAAAAGGGGGAAQRQRRRRRRQGGASEWLRRHADGVSAALRSTAGESAGGVAAGVVRAAVSGAEAAAEWAGGGAIARERVLLGVSLYCLAFKRGLWSALVLLFAIRAARITLQEALGGGFGGAAGRRGGGGARAAQGTVGGGKKVRRVLVRKVKRKPQGGTASGSSAL